MGIGGAFQRDNDDDGDLYDNEPGTGLDGLGGPGGSISANYF